MDYNNYFQNHYWEISDIQMRYYAQYFHRVLWDVFKNQDKTIRILEIWSGQWKFLNYISSLGYVNYVWFELDVDMTAFLRKQYPSFVFHSTNVNDYLIENPESFDIIFMSNVFEHLSVDEWKNMLKSIYLWMKSSGTFINIMPNAWSLFMSSYGRYNDITHKVLYTSASFNHILLDAGFKQVMHKNVFFTHLNSIIDSFWRLFQKVSFFILKYFLLLNGFPSDNILTFEIFTLAKK